MFVRLVGYLFRAMARFTKGDAGRDLDHVGAELLRLQRAPRQPAVTSR